MRSLGPVNEFCLPAELLKSQVFWQRLVQGIGTRVHVCVSSLNGAWTWESCRPPSSESEPISWSWVLMKFWQANTSDPGANAKGLKLEHSLTISLQKCDEHSFTAFHCFYSPRSCIFSRLSLCVCMCARFSHLTPLMPRQKDDEKKVESRRVYKTCEFVCEREK